MLQTGLVVIASILALIGNIPYLIKILKGKIKPHPYTWLIWSIVSCVVFFGQVEKGAGLGSIPTAVSEFFTIIIFLLSLKYGFKNPPKIDKYFLILALLSLIPWILTKDPTLSIIIVVSIDLIAFIPTLRKTYNEPKTENALLYGTNSFRHFLTLFALSSYNTATMLHSLVMIITNTLMVIFIKFSKKS